MGMMAGAAQRGPAPGTALRKPPARSPSDHRDAMLEALAQRVERSETPDWELDLDVYSAFGFPVRRKLAPSRGRGSPGGGIYQHGLEWKAVGHLGSDLALIVDVIAMVRPQLDWSLRSVTEGETLGYRAEIAGSSGMSMTAGSALCAAALRALAREAGPVAAEDRIGSPSARQAG